jgi:type I restriction enzyme S subunit
MSRLTRLPQAVLSKAFSGELVPTEAELARAEGREYESASALLARLGKAAIKDKPAKRAGM